MTNIKKLSYLIGAFIMFLTSCAPTHEDAEQVNSYPNLFPDYTNVTIPVNIAPLNFLIRDKDLKGIEVVATIKEGSATPESNEDNSLQLTTNGNTVKFNESEWKEFLQKAVGKVINVQVYSRSDNDEWTAFKPFTWKVMGDKIDPYMSYQLIEPDYKVWNKIQIKQRCLENFKETILADYNLQNNNCMNCHAYGNQNPNLSMLEIYQKDSYAILNKNGKLRKLDIQNDKMVSACLYYSLSPSGKYLAFSANDYEPTFHSNPAKRVEVIDKKSDVYVADLDNNTIMSSPLTSAPSQLETYPTFSPNGKSIYYCVTDGKGIETKSPKDIRYALVRIPFDEKTGRFGNQVDTLYTAHSVCHPRISPDGKYCLITVADYGSCPAWHPEANLHMLNLQTGKTDTLGIVNSKKSDSYHSWSHNSRWFVFGSKRDDGAYTKPYFCYVDRQGKAHKPFLLPQRDPSSYDYSLKCFNIPELSRGAAPYNAIDLERILRQPAEKFR